MSYAIADRRIFAGARFGRLVVEAYEVGGLGVQVKCDCGATKTVARANVLAGRTTSCGCRAREASRSTILRLSLRHGAARDAGKTPEYMAWDAMIRRCENPRTKSFHRYGGRGIKVCERWRASFSDFLADVGPRPSNRHSIGRIDNERGYEPGNVRWETTMEQAYNRRTSKLELHEVEQVQWLAGQGYARSEIGSFFGVTPSTVGVLCRRKHGEERKPPERRPGPTPGKMLREAP